MVEKVLGSRRPQILLFFRPPPLATLLNLGIECRPQKSKDDDFSGQCSYRQTVNNVA